MAGINRFGDEGAAAIARGLAKNTTLTRLSLQSNRIGPKGAEALSKVGYWLVGLGWLFFFFSFVCLSF